MGDHLDRKHDIRRLEEDPDRLKELIGQCAISREDARMLYMVHIEQQDQSFIADTMGMSVQNMRRRYTAALKKLHRLAQIKQALR